MRRVSVRQYHMNPTSGRWVLNGEFKEARFHQWGCQFEEFEAGPGNITMAIVEYDDGTVKLVGVEDIKFLDVQLLSCPIKGGVQHAGLQRVRENA